eukprot:m.109212 g.109212  ORF g.109212 m.109212 type:complete len:133 (-) comp15964_c0_seq3:783-1181(-)
MASLQASPRHRAEARERQQSCWCWCWSWCCWCWRAGGGAGVVSIERESWSGTGPDTGISNESDTGTSNGSGSGVLHRLLRVSDNPAVRDTAGLMLPADWYAAYAVFRALVDDPARALVIPMAAGEVTLASEV